MNIPNLVKNSVATAFKVAASMQVACVYHRITAGVYNPSTGAVGSTDTTTAINPIFGVYSQNEIDGSVIRTGDKKIVIRQSELAAEPKPDDFIVENVSTERWEVIEVTTEPTKQVWIVQGRKHAA